jgi:transposase
MADREIWGFKIQTSPSGKNIWPKALKDEVVRRIDEEGASTGEVAAELDAHDCLVRKWHVAARRSRGDAIASNGPTVAEVKLRSDALQVAAQMSTPEQARIIAGAICIEFPLSIDEARRPRRNHSPAFKAKVTVAAIKGKKIMIELAQDFDVHPSQIKRWRDQLLEGATGVFGETPKAEPKPIIGAKTLHAKIGVGRVAV